MRQLPVYENKPLAFSRRLPVFAAEWALAPSMWDNWMSLISPSLGVDAPSRGSCIFPSMLWLRSTATTIASHVSFATYDCGYSFSADSFEWLTIMAHLRAWLSVAPIMGFCQELTTTVPLLAFATKTHISWVSSLLALSMGIFRWSLLRLLLYGWLVIAKSQRLLI